MFNPQSPISYDRTDAQLEELILFLVAVAGKNAETTAKLLDKFFYTDTAEVSPFMQIKGMDTVTGMVMERIKKAGFGCHTRLTKGFLQLAYSKLDLRNCSLDELMEIHGVGRKSASCFLAWTRKDVKVAMLDTHLLKYLNYIRRTGDLMLKGIKMDEDEIYTMLGDKFMDMEMPKSTPSSKKQYDFLENKFLSICLYLSMNPTEWDLEIWKYYSKPRKELMAEWFNL
jgi:thermostable 8-oxoguanine DNA glycosylase